MKKQSAIHPRYTKWGRELNSNHVHQEYPRPQMRRKQWQNLNGHWDYVFCSSPQKKIPTDFDGQIVVPFSPESLLSGVGRQLLPGEELWYQRSFTLCKLLDEEQTILHFGAVDQICTVYINHQKVGNHEGGYLPFAFNVTPFLQEGENTISLAVLDASDTGIHAYGKQKLNRGGIWYTAQSGIWQTVWLEQIPKNAIQNLKVTPKYDEGTVEFDMTVENDSIDDLLIEIYEDGQLVASEKSPKRRVELLLPNFKSWHPDHPFLYNVTISYGKDRVESYFGMRKFSVEQMENGMSCFTLNNEPIFQTGLLDQGYWSDGLYTPPSDEAIIWELEEIKKMGFNMLRKHIKIEPLRWYYHCDRLGIIVWQDFVNGGASYSPWIIQVLPFLGIQLKDHRYRLFGRKDAAGRKQFLMDAKETVSHLYNVTSLAIWVPFNEGWGQFDSNEMLEKMKMLDSTRPIDIVSGWHDQGSGDFQSIHVYYRPVKIKKDKRRRAVAVSEFGGYSLPVKGHEPSDKEFGYKIFQTSEAFQKAYEDLYENQILSQMDKGICATIYTQVSDVEDEINGLFTYDRMVNKVDVERVKRINQQLKAGSES